MAVLLVVAVPLVGAEFEHVPDVDPGDLLTERLTESSGTGMTAGPAPDPAGASPTILIEPVPADVIPSPPAEPAIVPRPAPAPFDAAAFGAEVEARWSAHARGAGGVIADRQVIAYYGHPNSRRMGILGENDIEVMAEQLFALAARFDALNGSIGVAPAFHIIFATVWEDANVGIIGEARLREFIDYAAEHGILVFLDHQIGKGPVEGAIRRMLPYLRYPHVHLAFDPEWATTEPGKVIGSVTAEEVNLAQQMMQDYLTAHNLPGPRMLVVHQFNWRMIENRERVRADYPMVQLIHHADGFGNPAQKRDSWRFNNLAGNIPLKGFKLFYPKSWRAGGYDDPLMSPVEVLQLDPVPVYIQYQ